MQKVVTIHLNLWQKPFYRHEPVLTKHQETFIDGLPPKLVDINKATTETQPQPHLRLHQPVHSGRDTVDILMCRLCKSKHNPNTGASFETKAIQWYTDFFVNHGGITDETEVDKGIFAAFEIDFEDY